MTAHPSDAFAWNGPVGSPLGRGMWAPKTVDFPKRARYRVFKRHGGWVIRDNTNGLEAYAGDTWADAMRHVAARYDRLRRAQDYMNHFHPDQPDADEVIYAPGGWANG